jgi:hypothetical protein
MSRLSLATYRRPVYLVSTPDAAIVQATLYL